MASKGAVSSSEGAISSSKGPSPYPRAPSHQLRGHVVCKSNKLGRPRKVEGMEDDELGRPRKVEEEVLGRKEGRPRAWCGQR